MNYNEKNAHYRDALLAFDEPSHTYTVDGVQYETVTTLVEDCFEKFNAEYWAERKATADCPKEALLAKWAEQGKVARDLGTRLHDRIEHHYLGYLPDEEALSDLAFQHFLEFTKQRQLTPFRSEWRIFIEEFKVAGTLDFLVINPDGTYEIWDWKRSNKVVAINGEPIKATRFHKFGKGVVSHIEDTSYWHYALQVSIYRYILREKYGIETVGAYLGIFHPDYTQPHVVDLPYLEEDVINLLNCRNR